MKYEKQPRKRDSNDYIESQSDIVVGTNYNIDEAEFEKDDRETNSDFHDMFYVNDLFEDDLRFFRMLTNL